MCIERISLPEVAHKDISVWKVFWQGPRGRLRALYFEPANERPCYNPIAKTQSGTVTLKDYAKPVRNIKLSMCGYGVFKHATDARIYAEAEQDWARRCVSRTDHAMSVVVKMKIPKGVKFAPARIVLGNEWGEDFIADCYQAERLETCVS